MPERLAKMVTVPLDASGAATVALAPEKYGERWHVTLLSTRGNSATNPTLNVYRGAPTAFLLDTTDEANSAVSETDLIVLAGESLTAVYSGGTADALMTFYVEGEVTRGGVS